MDASMLLMVSLLCCAAWHVTASMLIFASLQRRNEPVSFLLLRFYILRYVSRYAELTSEETGRVGPLFYHYIISINLAALLAGALVLIHLL